MLYPSSSSSLKERRWSISAQREPFDGGVFGGNHLSFLMTTSTSQRRKFLLYYYFSFDENTAADSETRKKATPFVLFLAEERKPFETLLYVRCARVFGSGGKLKKIPFFLKWKKYSLLL